MALVDEAAAAIARARSRAGQDLEQLAGEAASRERAAAVTLPAGTIVRDSVTGERGIVEHTSFAHVLAPPAKG